MCATKVERVALDKLDATWNPFQSQYWALAKRPSGWRSFAFAYTAEGVEEDEHTSVVLVLVRRLFFGMRLAYVPFGPPVYSYKESPSSVVQHFSQEIRTLLPKGTAFIRFDLPWFTPDESELPVLTGKHIRFCRESVQPEGTAQIDLSNGIEAVRLQYRERARRNIRKSKSHGIVIKTWDGSQKALDEWYSVYLETAKRDGFSTRSESYLKHLLQLKTTDTKTHLYLAYQGSSLIGGAIILASGSVSVYLFGASLRVDGCSPSYLLQDYAMSAACDRGCKVYDLFGISGPQGRGSHLEGLRLFKRAFGGYVCYRHPSVDYVYRRLVRFMYTRVEQVRYSIHRRNQPRRMSQQFSVGRED